MTFFHWLMTSWWRNMSMSDIFYIISIPEIFYYHTHFGNTCMRSRVWGRITVLVALVSLYYYQIINLLLYLDNKRNFRKQARNFHPLKLSLLIIGVSPNQGLFLVLWQKKVTIMWWVVIQICRIKLVKLVLKYSSLPIRELWYLVLIRLCLVLSISFQQRLYPFAICLVVLETFTNQPRGLLICFKINSLILT